MPFTFTTRDYCLIARYLELNPYSVQRVISSSAYRSYRIGGVGYDSNTVDLQYLGTCLEQLDKDLGISEIAEESKVNHVKTLLVEIGNLEEQIKQLQTDLASQFKSIEVFEQYKWQRSDNKNGWDGLVSLKDDFISEIKTTLRVPTSSYNGLLIRSY